MENVRIKVEGMSCSSCVANLQKGLEEIKGVSEVRVEENSNVFDVTFDENLTNEKEIFDMIIASKYVPTKI